MPRESGWAALQTRPLALVTGGLGDIGRAVATTLARDGFNCLVLDLADYDAGEAFCSTADVPPNSLRYEQCDVRDDELLDRVIAALPRLDVAVVNAGVVQSSPFLSIDAEAWKRQVDINLNGAFFTSQSSARRMARDENPGAIIFMSSWVATRPWPEIAAYSASKAGLDQLMRQIALELAPLKIRAMAVAPGIVRAGMAREQLENEPQYAARAARSIPLGEPQLAQDIADAVSFLASSKAKTITGSVLVVDSGCSVGTLT